MSVTPHQATLLLQHCGALLSITTMSSLRTFRVVLSRDFDPEITSWNYTVANLPQARQTNAAGLVKCFSLVSSGTVQEIVLRFESAPSNRVTRKEPLDRLLLLSLADFRLRWPSKSPDDPPRVATGRENGNYITRLLTTGVVLNGIHYHFFGHSNSQTKSRSCFMYGASKEDISAKIEAMGDLSKLKSVGKKAKRIGLLFSSAEAALDLSPERCRDIDDVKRDDYVFTDGCGLISLQLARQLSQRRNIIFRNQRYLPSVFQIRYRGYKGVLTLDPTLQGKEQVQFRESMRKFKDASDHSFAVVDYSKPYVYGSLNDEVVVLLHTLGISADILLDKQQQHLHFLNNVSQGNPGAAFQYLSYSGRLDLAERLLLEGIGSVHTLLGRMIREEYTKMLNKRNEQRCRILIRRSRLLFGVCDPSSKNGHPGKLREVFVTWDPDIIPRTMAQPAQYPGGKELVTFGEVTGDARAEYFARYTSASMGKVKNLYMRWARLGHAMSPQCQQLNQLFSQCVDGNHIRIPDDLKEFTKLEDPSEPKHTVAPFILDVLHDACTQLILQAVNTRPNDCDEVDVMELFLARDKMAMSEFELLHLLLRWCEHSGEDILEYSHHLDFSALSDEQQIWFLSCLPPSATAPSLVRNGLLQSQLVTPDEVSKFRLDQPHLHWKPVFRSSTDRMQRFLPTVSQALEIFHKKLIILTVDERLSVAIYVPKKIERASEVQVDTGVVVFAFPHSQGLHSPNYKMLPTKVNYRLFCDEHMFQLYERQRSNTWIFLRRPQADDSLYRNEKNKGDKRRARETTVRDGVNFDCKASIALDKVGRGLQQHIGKVQQNGVLGAEIYVISNRDINSMRVLDEWLTFVDTDEVLPLFEKPNKNYDIPRLSSNDWADYPETVVAVVRDKDFAHLQKLKSVSELSTILGLLNDHGEKKMLLDTFSHVLAFEASSALSLDRTIVASTLLDFLPNAVYLIPAFFRSQTWETHRSSLDEHLIHMAFSLPRHLVLLSEEMGSFIRRPIQILLQELKCISLREFADIVELISLTVRSSETALDLLLGVLEPESSRLLVGRPTAIRQFTSSLFGIALDHVDEASSAREQKSREFLELRLDGHSDGCAMVKGTLRIDSSLNGLLKAGDHVRLTASDPPQNDVIARLFSMDAVVSSAEPGKVAFRCLHHPPSYLGKCAWSVTQCGSFVTSKTSFDAVTAFYTERETCSAIYAMLLGLPPSKQDKSIGIELPVTVAPSLNGSQNAALAASMKHSLTFIWGPPGTGKTHTIVVIITQLLEKLPKLRFLVTAPTHNAVDNMLRRFVAYPEAKNGGIVPVRVSTQLSKVAQDLRTYTCDAMVGKDLSANFPARRKAQKRIKEARLVFTTCTGAALGLLRNEAFDVVIIDEASQLTEPATLVPLVKGCSRAILVGDHVQLRATVQQTAVVTCYDVSLFERHYNLAPREGVAKVMLNMQYRMHRSICDFSSSEFYDSKLHTAVADNARPLPPSLFPWPKTNRMVWVECAAPEDLFQQSKSNAG
ncbi:uncharacterized protein J4E87_007466 [Alternaria ethzedia]|uniref:uncharacterized protein n=1 Tax=Alternaria ethzedia TaxID=181014 RepID=UPI0020C4BCBB|nr:uncharacterized protein J4E87_007466 [Alternaria ethzedia]KAI4619576.1 hypothetical protein J4E87_007466 [Alternaria ethzedia]